jgi:hypothetical protein
MVKFLRDEKKKADAKAAAGADKKEVAGAAEAGAGGEGSA